MNINPWIWSLWCSNNDRNLEGSIKYDIWNRLHFNILNYDLIKNYIKKLVEINRENESNSKEK